ILFWTALIFFAVAAGYVCENRLAQNRISSLSLNQENLDMLLLFRQTCCPLCCSSITAPFHMYAKSAG
ncbi:MAG TPA: hypothetical protein PKD78_06585, partial [Saprospiraceae bacterium]|nr:hypothetical protein [Saprospiraceae bacterium]